MPIGNIVPRTSSLTLNAMKLGPEEYPSTTQQAESENTGYLLYAPFRTHQFRDDAVAIGSHGTFLSSPGTRVYSVYQYIRNGIFDLNSRIVAFASDGNGTLWLELGTLQASSYNTLGTVEATIIETYENITISDGWHQVSVKAYTVSTITEIYVDRVDSFLRQNQ